jgi:nitroimidazol reductase NimA-like FMN-containing flavoprotein (pyridoxamine 5'-phosphate oxidase superfamily)
VTDAWLEVLADDECVALLRDHSVGRIAFDVDGTPAVLPINYRLVEAPPKFWIALRTRPGNVIDRPQAPVAFEIDNIDPLHHDGWSVLVRGTLHQINDRVPWIRERFDSEPWLATERDSWLLIDPFEISGRRLHAAENRWTFDRRAGL